MGSGIGCALQAILSLAPATPVQDPALSPPALEEQSGEPISAEADAWEFDTSLLASDPPGSGDRVTAIVYADRGPLHLEARYGYEDVETGSLFAGWTFAGGEEVTASVTPMLGVVVGRTDGIAPGVELEVGWKKIAWYVEAEYLLDAHDSSDDYFYSWSTLMYGFTDWLSVGLVTERTKIVDTDFELQHGLALQVARERLSLGLYVYNVGTDDSYAVVSFGLGL